MICVVFFLTFAIIASDVYKMQLSELMFCLSYKEKVRVRVTRGCLILV